MIGSHPRRGSLLIAALLLFSLLLVLGLGLMSSQVGRRRAVRAQIAAAQAKQLCLTGWQDAKVKLGLDILFPPYGAQASFSYSEDVYDINDHLFGTYTVNIDLHYQRTRRHSVLPIPLGTDPAGQIPEGFYIISCTGKIGDRGFEPLAERTMIFEMDMTTFRVLRVTDRGSL